MSLLRLGSTPSPPPLVRDDQRRRVVVWLGCTCALVLAMVIVGGLTRLTGSGLSIVTWKPVTGVVPPLSEADWVEAFTAYQSSPQYRLVNSGMTLGEFKYIFLWEYIHRLLGRGLGVVFAAPFVYFLVKRALSRALIVRLSWLFALGGLQGLVGWLMVASGLVDRPSVSHYRLAAHLSLALALFAVLLFTALDVVGRNEGAPRRTRLALRAFFGLLSLQILYGAFTAGLRAGIGYNTFPLMHGQWIPSEVFAFAPVWRNALENRVAIQLIHRILGVLLVLAVAGLLALARGAPRRVRWAITTITVATAVQFGLGVATLVMVVPISLAAVHQFGACCLFAAAVWANHEASAPRASHAARAPHGHDEARAPA